jgi:hypothetical protein
MPDSHTLPMIPSPSRILLALACLGLNLRSTSGAPRQQTEVSIRGEDFLISGQPTYAGRVWKGHRIEGLLLNSRMVQGIFDDRNSETAGKWAYSDTGKWDPERNTREFLDAMPEWRRHGLLGITLNFQGGSPQGYSKDQPWENNAYNPDGTLRPEYTARLERILNRADELGMVVILGYFYFGQDERLRDDAAVLRACDSATAWLLDHGYRNVLVEVTNEANVRYDHSIFQEPRHHELIERIKAQTREGRRLLVGTSFGGGTVPWDSVVKVSDFVLIHGNGQNEPQQITNLIRKTRALPSFRPMPVVINEDDHFDFEKPENNFVAAVRDHVSWGYFDFRMKGEGFDEGYQTVPVNWTISSSRKRSFFKLLVEITGAQP